jgi:hypothetical protein
LKAYFDAYVDVGYTPIEGETETLSFLVNSETGEVYDWDVNQLPSGVNTVTELPFYCPFIHQSVPGVTDICSRFSALMKKFKKTPREFARLDDKGLIAVLHLLVLFLLLVTKQNLSPVDVEKMGAIFDKFAGYFPHIDIPTLSDVQKKVFFPYFLCVV